MGSSKVYGGTFGWKTRKTISYEILKSDVDYIRGSLLICNGTDNFGDS